MGKFSDWLKGGKNYREGEIEYYEDTHDDMGNYKGTRPENEAISGRYISPASPARDATGPMQKYVSPSAYQPRDKYPPEDKGYGENYQSGLKQSAMTYSGNPAAKPYALPDKNQYISPRNYQNLVVYEPKTPEDVQNLIDYLRRREPAVVNLDNVGDEATAQRILDFLSGAIYALNGTMHRIAGNIFLLSPEGVEITVPYDVKF